jgi:hypothetical protein
VSGIVDAPGVWSSLPVSWSRGVRSGRGLVREVYLKSEHPSEYGDNEADPEAPTVADPPRQEAAHALTTPVSTPLMFIRPFPIAKWAGLNSGRQLRMRTVTKGRPDGKK